MSIQRQFSSGVAWMAAGNWLEQAINFGVFVLLARILGAAAFGLLAMAAAFVLFSEFLVRDSFSDFLIAHENPAPEHFNATFWMLASLGALLSAILLLAAGPIATFYGQAEVRGLIMGLSPTVLMIALTAVPVTILRRELRFRTLSMRAVAGVLVGGIVAVSMALNGFGVWSLAGQRLAQVFTNIVMAWAAVKWRPGGSTSMRHCRDVFRFGGAVLGLRAAELAAIQLPSIIIGAVLGPAVLGFFSIAWRLVEIGSFLIVTPLRMAAQPAFAAITRSGAAASELLVDISRLSGMVAFPAFAGLSVLSVPVIALLFGEKWVAAAPILSVLSVLGVYFCIEKINQAFCLAAGRAGPTAALAWAETSLAAVLVWALSFAGVTAMAAGLVSAFLLLWVVRFRIVGAVAKAGAWELARCHVLPLLGSALMAGAVYFVLGLVGSFSALGQVLVGTVTGAAIYSVFTLMFMFNRLGIVKGWLQPG